MLSFIEFKRLLEMPEHRKGTKDQSAWIKHDDIGNAVAFISNDTVNRNFIKIKKDELSTLGGEYEILLSKRKGLAGLYLPSVNSEGETIYYVICLVYFKRPIVTVFPTELSHKESLQVDKVATVPNYESQGLASIVYNALAEYGFIVISDTIQFDGGKFLWKKLARNDELNVFVYDRETQDVFKDSSGIPINYNGRNIPDNQIWAHSKAGQIFILIAHR
jgi:hypothetical protein